MKFNHFNQLKIQPMEGVATADVMSGRCRVRTCDPLLVSQPATILPNDTNNTYQWVNCIVVHLLGIPARVLGYTNNTKTQPWLILTPFRVVFPRAQRRVPDRHESSALSRGILPENYVCSPLFLHQTGRGIMACTFNPHGSLWIS